MDWLYQQLIAGKQKAVAGFLAAALVAFLADNGVQLPADAKEVVSALLLGVVGLVSVYLTRNK